MSSDSPFSSIIQQLRRGKQKHVAEHASELVSTLFFHENKHLRCAIAKEILFTNESEEILSPSQMVLETASRRLIAAKYTWYALSLEDLSTSYNDELRLAWPETPFCLFKGDFGNVAKDVYCKTEKAEFQCHLQFSLTGANTNSRNSIMREIAVLVKLHENTQCRNIASLVAFNEKEDHGPLFYIIQCKESRNLSAFLLQKLHQKELLPLAELLQLNIGILQAFIFCQERGILLRDTTACSFLLQTRRELVPKLVPSHLSSLTQGHQLLHGKYLIPNQIISSDLILVQVFFLLEVINGKDEELAEYISHFI